MLNDHFCVSMAGCLNNLGKKLALFWGIHGFSSLQVFHHNSSVLSLFCSGIRIKQVAAMIQERVRSQMLRFSQPSERDRESERAGERERELEVCAINIQCVSACLEVLAEVREMDSCLSWGCWSGATMALRGRRCFYQIPEYWATTNQPHKPMPVLCQYLFCSWYNKKMSLSAVLGSWSRARCYPLTPYRPLEATRREEGIHSHRLILKLSCWAVKCPTKDCKNGLHTEFMVGLVGLDPPMIPSRGITAAHRSLRGCWVKWRD